MSVLSKLTAPLLRLGDHDVFTVGDSFEGLTAFGGTGSGKTSTTGRLLASSFLNAGWGGLVLAAKPSEPELWQRYARAAGRTDSLILFDGSGKYRFNFLDYAMTQFAAMGAALASNVAHLLTVVLLAAKGNAAPAQGGSSEAFWQSAMKEALTHSVALLWAVNGTITLDAILSLIQSRPGSHHWIDVAPPKPGETSTNLQVLAAWHWQKTSQMYALLQKAKTAPKHPMAPEDYRVIENYLCRVLANPDQKVTGNLIASLSADLAPLMTGPMREILQTTTNVVPEMTRHGAIIVMALTLKEWEAAGVLAQQIMKFCFQRAAERNKNVGNPVFLFADEGHMFCSPYDAEFQSTARESRTATVYMSQNILGYYERIGGRNAEYTAKSWISNFSTKVFHANTDADTNRFAAEMIGKKLHNMENWTKNEGENTGTNDGWSRDGAKPGKWFGGTDTESGGRNRGEQTGYSQGKSQQRDYILQPDHFTGLRTGGARNGLLVDAVMMKSAAHFAATGGQQWLPLILSQKG